jgi:serine/threonine-protein kinase
MPCEIMTLAVGTQLGSHEITASLGKGGMGEVYRARDTKLKREVAIKILPDEFSRDTDRVARFQREAEVLASLNHPNIAAIYDLQEARGSRFLVLELVEGETLAERIQRGSVPIGEALSIAKSICEALEAAHEKGVVHRDLKPSNVKITSDGKVKVLDFGLAKAMETPPANANLSNSPTLSVMATNAGVILGTAAYMSPEQARGENTDHRSDIFAFGCVLYEMLTGRQAFQGKTVSDILASVLAREPDLNLLPPKINPRATHLLRRAIDKGVKRRWQTVADMRAELEAILADGAILETAETAKARPLWKRAIPVFAASVMLSVITGLVVWNLRQSIPAEIMTFPFNLPDGQRFTNTGRSVIAISPDGTQMVYVANSRLYLRKMSELEARPIPGTEVWRGVTNPVFSPDGGSIVFWSGVDSSFKKIAVTGGAAVTICPADNPYGMNWDASGIVFGQGAKGIMRVSANGGKPELLLSPESGALMDTPQLLPDGQSILFTLAASATTVSDRWDRSQIVVQSLKSGTRKTLIEGGSAGRYVPTGHIVFAFGGTLRAAPFNLRRLEVTGGPVPVIEGIMRADALQTGVADFSVSQNGSLVFVPARGSSGGPQRVLAFVDRKGTAEPLKLPPGPYEYPRISPDGKRLAFDTDDGKEGIVWIYELSGASAVRRLTFGSTNRYPMWAGNNDRVAFQSNREGDTAIFWQSADGGTAERLTKPDQGIIHVPGSWPSNSQRFTFSSIKGAVPDVWMFSLLDKKATPFAATPAVNETRSALSPDGGWVAYVHVDQPANQVFVQPYPSTGAKYQISREGTGASEPSWSPDGKELFYVTLGAGAKLMAVNIKTQPAFTFSDPVALPIQQIVTGPIGTRNYDISPDGKRFIVIIDAAQAQPESRSTPQIQIVLNWFEELKQKVPVH